MKLLRGIWTFIYCVAFYLVFVGGISYLMAYTWVGTAWAIIWLATLVAGVVWFVVSLARELWQDRWGRP